MNYNKILKRETKIIAYVVVCLTLAVMGISYALFLQVNHNTKNQVVNAGSLEITYSQGNMITVDEDSEKNCLMPQSDEDGTGNGGCQFKLSITNKGTLPMQYNLLIYDNKNTAETELPADAKFVNHSLIRHSLSKQHTEDEPSEVITEAAALSTLTAYNKNRSKKVLEKSVIEIGETIIFTLNIWISEDATTDIVGQYVSLKLDVVGTVYDENNEEDPDYQEDIVCKRATVLHTDTCGWGTSDDTCGVYEGNGNIIRYGNLGTTGNLEAGDAFDCDVNGDGTFDPDTERFYYVADVNDEVAALIYYSNVQGGIPTDNYTTKYSSAYSSENPATGVPDSAIEELPSNWSNVYLFNSQRDLVNETGEVLVAQGIDYLDKNARLITYNEVIQACGSENDISQCKYLFENSAYSSRGRGTYWIETRSKSPHRSFFSGYSKLYTASVSSELGVRPVIEVAKTRIEY